MKYKIGFLMDNFNYYSTEADSIEELRDKFYYDYNHQICTWVDDDREIPLKKMLTKNGTFSMSMNGEWPRNGISFKTSTYDFDEILESVKASCYKEQSDIVKDLIGCKKRIKQLEGSIEALSVFIEDYQE